MVVALGIRAKHFHEVNLVRISPTWRLILAGPPGTAKPCLRAPSHPRCRPPLGLLRLISPELECSPGRESADNGIGSPAAGRIRLTAKTGPRRARMSVPRSNG